MFTQYLTTVTILFQEIRLRTRQHTAVAAAVAGVLLGVVGVFLVAVPRAGAEPFGLHDFDVTFAGPNGEAQSRAGSHPFAYDTSFKVNLDEGGSPAGAVKDLRLAQIPGLAGIPTAVPRCSSLDFLDRVEMLPDQTDCADGSAVGLTTTELGAEVGGEQTGAESRTSAVYNLEPPPGVAAKLGFYVAGVPVTVDIGVSERSPYEIVASVRNISQVLEFEGSKFTIWGVPGSPLHDPLRGACVDHTGESIGDCPAGVGEVPFLISPRACQGPLLTSWAADSWSNPGALLSNGAPDLSDPFWATGEAETHEGTEPKGFDNCGSLAFSPTITAQPTTKATTSPTGLDFHLDVADEGLTNPLGIAQSDIKKTVVTLPEGMTANPSLAEGLNVCSETDLKHETAKSLPGEGCPEESKIGTVEVETPLLQEALKGSLYIAKPYQNPFNSLLALYFVIKNPTLGISITQAAKVEPDLQTGRIVTVVENIPQLPFSHFKLHFREGARSPLVSPPFCGTYNAKAVLTPWSGGEPITTTSAFQIISGANAGPCPAGGTPPFAPGATAGTLNNAAGSYSPFDLRITRKDGEQQLTRFSTIMPPGLTGNLTGIPFCPDSAIETARHKTGAQEKNEPSCPAASQIGHTLVGAGVGGVLAQAPGKVYLAGPYNGAPLSIVSITSATVGPFDLGTVVIRFALRINPTTAQVEIDSAGSDPIPHIIQGIVVNVREIHAYIDRQHFIINPTNCDPLSIQNTITGAGSNIASPTDDIAVITTSRFQAADCANLSFKPNFQVTTSGKTSKANGASLTVKLSFPNLPQGTQANIRSVKVDLPKQLPSRLTTLQKACTAAQFHTNPAGCPAASVVGHARAITPILPVPLEGPAYFVSNGGEAFPNLIMVLQGYGITIDLVGDTFISKTGITSSTFKTVPDQPVTSFELVLPQGPYSALTANGNLCTSKLSMPTEFIGQNGALLNQNTKVAVTGCPKVKTLTRAQKLALALKACHKQHNHAKRKACERAARKKYGPLGRKAKRAKRKG
jgi:hypothetical protein